MTISTELAAAAIFALLALYCYKRQRGVSRWLYTAGLGAVAATLAVPSFPDYALAVFNGTALSGFGQMLITAACVLGCAVVGLRYILNIPPAKKKHTKR